MRSFGRDRAEQWRELAEPAHFVDLHQTGRRKHYYTEELFLTEMRGGRPRGGYLGAHPPSDKSAHKTK